MWIEIALVCVLLFFLWDKLPGGHPANFPPGPRSLPIVGNLTQLAKNPLAAVGKWKSQYGNVVGLKFGDFRVVMISGYDTIKEAFDKAEFSGRPLLGPFVLITGGLRHGITLSEGQTSTEQRRFALRHLRDFGFGKKSMEGTIQEDVRAAIKDLLKNEGIPIETNRRFSMFILSALWNILAGERFEYDDPKFKKATDDLNAAFSSTSISGPVFFMPWLAKLMPKLSGWDNFAKTMTQVKTLIGGVIQEHKKTFEEENLRDFMDVYINEIKSTTDPNVSFHKNTGDSNMEAAILNLFAAGAETTSNTLNWAVYLLAKHQTAQDKMHEEIDQVVGRSRLPGFEDREKMIYTEAVMLEVFRFSSLTPFGVFHTTMNDVKFHGYDIPKDTIILPNLYDVHYNKEVWGDPETFRPERFLSPDGKKLSNKDKPIMPFSTGKRVCLGETLARSEFFLFLTGIMQRFDMTIKLGDASTLPMSLFRFAPPFKVILKDRLA